MSILSRFPFRFLEKWYRFFQLFFQKSEIRTMTCALQALYSHPSFSASRMPPTSNMSQMKFLPPWIAFSLVFCAIGPAFSIDILVTTLTDEDNSSLDPAAGGGDGISLREAINYSASGDDIIFDGSLSGETVTLTNGQLTLSHDLSITAPSDSFTIDANQQSRVMEVQPNTTVTLTGLTLTGGHTTENGGAIFVNGRGEGNSVSLSLFSCHICDNTASFLGGGIYNLGRASGTASLSIDSCTISANSALAGGGIFNFGLDGEASLALQSSTISDNHASSNGGGINSDGRFGVATLTLNSCTISGNSSLSSGGGLFNNGSEGSAFLNLTSSTVTNNTSLQVGGGIQNQGPNGGCAIFDIENSIVAGNFSDLNNGSDLFEFTGSNGSTVTNASGINLFSSLRGQNSLSPSSNVLVEEPLLAPLANYGGPTMTHHPLAASPAITNVSNAPPRSDQRGFSPNTELTIGAVQVGPIHTVTDSGNMGAATLRGALDPAINTELGSPGSVIHFAFSLDSDTITLAEQLVVPSIANHLFIDGSFLPNGITLDADTTDSDDRRVMEIQPNAAVAIHGATFTGGSVSGKGGAILADGSGVGNSVSLALSLCTVTGNSAESGGGVASEGNSGGRAFLSLNSCTIADNSALQGGGIFQDGSSGGEGTLSLGSCTISENTAVNGGGGIFSFADSNSDSLSIDSCTITDNSSFSDDASAGGGGIFLGVSTLHLEDSILAGNSSPTAPDLKLSDSSAISAVTSLSGNNIISNIDTVTTLPAVNPGLIVTEPLLAPLAFYGGPTMTHHPLANSPAILGGNNIIRNDQRGFAVSGPLTIGAVQAREAVVVTHNSNDGANSLRESLNRLDSSPVDGAFITFDPASFNSETITLTEQLSIPNNLDGLFIDASTLPNGLILNANASDGDDRRVMSVQFETTVALHNITFTGGNSDGRGGAIYIDGFGNGNLTTVSLSSCTISDNSAFTGGGIYNDGFENGSASLFIHSSTIANNSSVSNGGGIYNDGDLGRASLNLDSCTISGNFTAVDGGGIFTSGSEGEASLDISSSTISDNSALNTGGGIQHQGPDDGFAILNIENSIIAGNFSNVNLGPDLFELNDNNGTTLTNAIGINLFSVLDDHQSSLSPSTSVLVEPALLAPLAHYGGPTMTQPPLLGSAAIDAAGPINMGGTDQRGLPRFFNEMLDIGATEFQGEATELNLAFNLDLDGDGLPLGLELAIGTDPNLADAEDANTLRLVSFAANGNPQFTFGVDSAQEGNIILSLVRSTNLLEFEQEVLSNASGDFPTLLADSSPPAGKAFYRLEAKVRP